MLKVPTTFTVMTLTKRPRSWGASLPIVRSASAIPAQLTSTCRPPNSFTASATAALPSASFATSVRAKRPPISFASFSPASTCRSAITTFAPFSAAMRAVAAPRPDAPPVTRNMLFLICIGNSAVNSPIILYGMHLGFGCNFRDLYERAGLLRIDAAFLAFLAEADAALRDRLVAARAQPPAAKAESDLLVALAPHVEDFLARLFGIEKEARALAARHNVLAPRYSV